MSADRVSIARVSREAVMVNGVGGSPDAAAAAQAVTDVLVNAQQKSMEAAEKLLKTTLEMALGAESGKGGTIDLMA